MSNWATSDLTAIKAADDLHISPFREDGVTYGTPTWVWSVVVDGSLYVRAYNGQKSSWYNAAITQRAGRVRVAGLERNVAFEPVEGSFDKQIDAAYSVKYAKSPYLSPMLGARARSATVRISPLERKDS